MLKISESYVTLFQVDVQERYVRANASSSRTIKHRDSDDRSYKNSYWNAMFVGKCLEQAKQLTDRDRIKILNGYISNETSEKDGELILNEKGKPRHFVNLTIFEFEVLNHSPQKTSEEEDNGNSSESNIADTPDEELPF